MDDLKDLVIKALDKNGSLDIIRTQLRASVFTAIQSEQKKVINPEPNKHADKETLEYSYELLKDFLEKSEASSTLKILESETIFGQGVKNRLQKKFNLLQGPDPDVYKIIKSFKASFVPVSQPAKAKEDFGQSYNKKEEDKKSDQGFSDNYSEDFEEIEEDIETFSQGTGLDSQRILMSSSGADPSVDSQALEKCDYLEPVKRSLK
jgi:hypothetical protein